MCCVLFVVYHSTVLCQQSNAKKCFKGNYITMYFVFCIVCCVVYCLLCITVLCCANNEMQIFTTKFYKTIKFILCKLLNVFSSVVEFSMSACSVRLMWPSLWWSCCVLGAVTPSFCWPDWAVGRWRPWACHATNHNIFIYQPIFTTKNSAISRL